MKNNKKTVILSIILVAALIIAVMSITYAYFSTKIDTDDEVNINTETSSQANVIFTPGEEITFVNAEPGYTTETEFSISLEAPNKTDDTITYGLIWNITENSFSYENEYPNDAQLTYDLYYRMSETDEWTSYVIDADCTTWSDDHKIVDGLTLSATENTTSTIYWKFVLEYKAYDYNQATNMLKAIKGSIEFDSTDI